MRGLVLKYIEMYVNELIYHFTLELDFALAAVIRYQPNKLFLRDHLCDQR